MRMTEKAAKEPRLTLATQALVTPWESEAQEWEQLCACRRSRLASLFSRSP
jgi:hypothetical protein